MFNKIALALAFSPTCKALLLESIRIKNLYQSRLILIHIGPKTEANEAYLKGLLEETGLDYREEDIIWKEGKPAKEILSICKTEQIDLLIAGALKRENLFVQYLGSVARKILRKSACSVLVLVSPSESPKPFTEIVIDTEDHPLTRQVVEAGFSIGKKEISQLHLVREIQLYGLSTSIASEGTEKELASMRKKIVQQEFNKLENIIDKIETGNLRINYKILAGKSGFELAKYSRKIKADLLVVGALPKKFALFDRVFIHDLEYIFVDLPCNLLVIKAK